MLNQGENMLPAYGISLSRNAIREISNRVEDMLDIVFDMYEEVGMDAIEDLFPEHLFVEDPNLCVKKLREFRSIVNDNFTRDCLEPIYEYILYQVLNIEIDLLNEKGELYSFDYEKYFDKEGNVLEEIPEDVYIKDVEGYLDILFEDYDFLIVTDGLESELNDYQLLMPKDIRDKVKTELQNKQNPIEDIIIRSFLNAIDQIELQPTLYEECTEPQLNDHIFSIIKQLLLSHNIIVEREKLQGFANFNSEESDFYLSDTISGKQIAVGESKNINLFEKTVKQLLGYMNRKSTFGFTISINKSSSIPKCFNKINSTLNVYKNSVDFKLKKLLKTDDYIISYHEMPENSNNTIILYHLILNLNTKSRREIAKRARIR